MAPVKILIMRHAEKPDDPSDPNLSPEGQDRAKALVTWYPETFGPPDVILPQPYRSTVKDPFRQCSL